jgi:DNA invertase Pin-like site-specific DNA recombinase
MTAATIGYARTSTTDQEAGLEIQLAALRSAGCTKIYQEQVSAVGQRPQLEAALEYVREGDCLVALRPCRVARNVRHLLDIVDRLEKKGVALRILDFGGSALDTKGPSGRLILTILGAISQFERELMLERQRAGVAVAKAAGKYRGRVPTARRQADKIVALKSAGHRPEDIAKELKVSRASVFRVLKEQRAASGTQ